MQTDTRYQHDRRLIRALGYWSRGAAAIAALTGALGLIGWWAALPALTAWVPGAAPMRPNTALGLILAGLGTAALAGAPGRARRRAAQAAGGLATLLGGLTLLEYLAGWDLGIDQLVARVPAGMADTAASARGSPNGAAILLLIGAALLLAARRHGAVPAQAAALLAGFVALAGVVGYLYGISMLYGVAALTPLAPHTAAVALVLALGVAALRPVHGIAGLVTRADVGGLVVRRLAVAVVLVPVALGWLGNGGYLAGWYGPLLDVVVVVLGSILVFGGLVLGLGTALSRTDRARRAAMRALEAAQASLEQRVVERTTALARANAALTGEIAERKRAEEEIRRLNSTLEARVQARTAELAAANQSLAETAAALRAQTVALERSNADLQQFAYVASHDLQEPLRTISSFTQLLARRYRGRLDADADEFIAFVVDGTARMQTLINDLLAYSRVGTRTRPFAPVPVDEVLARVLANLRIAIAESGASLRVESMPVVWGDESQLLQLFQNLIANALKFRGAAPPVVEVRATVVDGIAQFAVADNGIGIAPQYAERIFVLFQRLHTREQYPGTGIGLALCKKIVERHGGRIWMESAPGAGTTFSFTLPAAAGDLPAPELDPPAESAPASRAGSPP